MEASNVKIAIRRAISFLSLGRSGALPASQAIMEWAVAVHADSCIRAFLPAFSFVIENVGAEAGL